MSRDEYSEAGTGMVKATVPLLLALVALFAFYARWAGWMSDKVFSPREEQVRRETFKQSQAYNDGMAQDLDRMFLDYGKADEAGRGAIRSVVLHRTAAYDLTLLPGHLSAWVRSLRGQ